MRSIRLIQDLCLLFILLIIMSGCQDYYQADSRFTSLREIDFNTNWKFYRCDQKAEETLQYLERGFDDTDWEAAMLPHTPAIEPLVVNDQWQGICWYRKYFKLDSSYLGKKIFLTFEGAMQVAEVWVNEIHKTTHYGGYLPFTIDITEEARLGRVNTIAVRLDNRDNPEVPPGKPLQTLDFCLFGGLYRNVSMQITDRLHITDAVFADQKAGGGIFVRYPQVSDDVAEVWVQTHVVNEYEREQGFAIVTQLYDADDQLILTETSGDLSLQSMEDRHYEQTLRVSSPALWSPDSPYLYRLRSRIVKSGQIIDEMITDIGIRSISFSAAEGFKINGKKFYLRGTNRHQEYPYIGYALSDNAHYRDALSIKKAGFDFVRLSHYPHSRSFMEACNKLGILLMDAIPGWQFFGNELFQQRSWQDCRDMIRRDRNHPSVIAWEVSLNESPMSEAFMDSCQAIAHEEYLGDQCYTAGWMDYAFDIFIPARQHARPPYYWDRYDKDKPLFIAEYGDWEYYAQNAGFNQEEFQDLTEIERTSRQFRGDGEKRLLQQALNYQEAFNDNLDSPAAGCANWLVFDYNRGYADDIEASGIMDIFRLPKFAYYFYQSQRGLLPEQNPGFAAGPMVFIANNYTETSNLIVKVFSNCEKVSLMQNGREIASRLPDEDRYSSNLKHSPFTFHLDKYEPGKLTAAGFINNAIVAEHTVMTPLQPQKIRLSDNCQEIKPHSGKQDVFFIYASIIDKNGTVVPTAELPIVFEIEGPAELVGENPVKSEAGIASILVRSSGENGTIRISAENSDLGSTRHFIHIKNGNSEQQE